MSVLISNIRSAPILRTSVTRLAVRLVVVTIRPFRALVIRLTRVRVLALPVQIHPVDIVQRFRMLRAFLSSACSFLLLMAYALALTVAR